MPHPYPVHHPQNDFQLPASASGPQSGGHFQNHTWSLFLCMGTDWKWVNININILQERLSTNDAQELVYKYSKLSTNDVQHRHTNILNSLPPKWECYWDVYIILVPRIYPWNQCCHLVTIDSWIDDTSFLGFPPSLHSNFRAGILWTSLINYLYSNPSLFVSALWEPKPKPKRQLYPA